MLKEWQPHKSFYETKQNQYQSSLTYPDVIKMFNQGKGWADLVGQRISIFYLGS